ncbi:AAHS family 4-hydroxybenzoate transporter-like MFS transporter [Paraburkholderia sp. BL6669N2]|uniref:MFS transporter n=1 Tax=Paraburkholderia sp. BL6669N2 TaxID=1938807 RepID=UPI000E241B6C|nr:MFS transporter [Paraburkholderia sp. BL6669N2]REG49009.1 AAHS family 4-hydroxybenzoate transporter-like MFS transporter [Paraburkholderia sp. BL6669N2]
MLLSTCEPNTTLRHDEVLTMEETMEISPTARAGGLHQLIDSQKFGWFHAKVAILCFLIVVLDGFDTTLIGFVAPSIANHWHVSRRDLAPLVSAALMGVAIGALLSGPLADRYGRKVVLIVGVAWFGVLTLVSPLAPDVTWLAAFRLVTGLGLGATISNASTLAAEYAPARNRSATVTSVLCGFTLGSAAGGFAAAMLMKHWGWPSVFYVCGALSLLLVPVLILALPESIHFMVSRRRSPAKIERLLQRVADNELPYAETIARETAARVSAPIPRTTASSKLFGLSSVMLWLAFFCVSLSGYILLGWLPMLLSDAGFSPQHGAVILGIFQTAGVIGVLSLGWLMDRWNPHLALAGAFLFGAIAFFSLGSAVHDAVFLGILIAATGFFIGGSGSGIFALAALTYPTDVRATGTSWMSACGRLGGILSGFVGAYLLSRGWTLTQVAMLMSLPVLVSCAAIVIKWVRLKYPRNTVPTRVDGIDKQMS